MPAERRRNPRKSAQATDTILFSTPQGHRFLCPLLDISANGMRLHMPIENTGELKRADIVIRECPDTLRPILGDMRGEVVWAAGDSCGVAFRDALCVTSRELHELLDDRRLLPQGRCRA